MIMNRVANVQVHVAHNHVDGDNRDDHKKFDEGEGSSHDNDANGVGWRRILQI